MKRTLLCTLCSLMLSMLGVTAWGQSDGYHIPNGDFSKWKDKCGSTYQTSGGTLTGKGNPVGLTQRPGTEPSDWNGSNVKQKVFVNGESDKLVTKGEENGNAWTVLTNTYVGIRGVAGSNAPAYITFGTPWVYAISNTSNCDGGTYGGTEFKGRPDAIKGRFKRTKGSAEENAHVIAYLWTGTFTSEIACSDSKNDLTTMSIDDVDKAVLGKVEGSAKGTLIASCDSSFATTKDNEWVVIEIPFSYGRRDVRPSKMNVIVSSADYWTRANIQSGSKLEVDDLEFVYYHTLSSCMYNDKSVVFDGNNNAVIDSPFEKDKFKCEKKGVGASVEESYNSITGLLTITVKGDDVDVNPESKTVYTIQFKPVADMAVTNAKYGTFFAPFDVEVTSGTAYACMSLNDNVLQLQEINGDIPAFTPVLLKSENPYEFTKTGSLQNNAEVYNGDLVVTVAGIKMPEQNTDVAVVNNQDGTINFVLDNFVLEGFGGVGNIHVNGLAKDANGKFSFKGIVTITEGNKDGVEDWMGPGLGNVPLDMEGSVTASSLTVSINIDMTSSLGDLGNVQVRLTCDGEPKTAFVLSVGRMGLLTGVLEETSAPIGSYVLQDQDGNVAFYRVFEGEEYAKPVLPANRCYLTAPASSEAGVKAISFPEDPTAIDAVKDLLSGKAEIYDLEGRRLPALQKGLNIVNGKKVMVK